MTPAEQLAAARSNVVGPYLPAREEWLRGWAGYVMWSVSPNTDALGAAIATGFVLNGRAELRLIDGTTMQRPDRVRLDVHRPEVRDHLVRLGCPEWARDVPAAVWAWGSGVEVADVITPWSDAADLAALNAGCILREPGGWLVPLPGGGVGFFREPSP